MTTNQGSGAIGARDEVAMNGSGGALTAEAEARAMGKSVGVETNAHERERRSWFSRVVGSYMKRHRRRAAAEKAAIARGEKTAKKVDDRPAPERANSAIRWACIKSAVTGATAGAISTTATMLTAETEGLAGIVAVPFAAATIGGEMIYRAFVHVDLTCELAEIFEVKFDTENEADLWRLYALAFGTDDHEEGSSDPGAELIHSVTHTEGEQVGEKIGSQVLGESVMRNIVPFFGIVSSAVTNYVLTKRLGDTVRRAMRYQRAMDDTFETWSHACEAHLDLLIEGMWFVFTADGKLSPEEVTCLAKLLDKLDPVRRHAVMKRFTDDEIDFLERITAEIPTEMRPAFLRALEVGAAVDKIVGLPEKKILRRVAHHLDIELDMAAIQKMIDSFTETGFMAGSK
jgi:uncharacterized tellurite resistance protein B-like protein